MSKPTPQELKHALEVIGTVSSWLMQDKNKLVHQAQAIQQYLVEKYMKQDDKNDKKIDEDSFGISPFVPDNDIVRPPGSSPSIQPSIPNSIPRPPVHQFRGQRQNHRRQEHRDARPRYRGQRQFIAKGRKLNSRAGG